MSDRPSPWDPGHAIRPDREDPGIGPGSPHVPRLDLTGRPSLLLSQRFEAGEFLGFETRNRYRIVDADGLAIGQVAEPGDGALGFLARQFAGHWRSFDLHFLDALRRRVMTASHPFRLYFTRLDLFDANGRRIGGVEKRFGILYRRFVVEDARGRILMTVSTPIWRLWTFPLISDGRLVAKIAKRWSGAFSEALSDRDDFSVTFVDPALTHDQRMLVLAAAVYADLTWFERKR